MSVAPGARLGPYEVLDRIGAGGMGEVYRARDTRLDRVVAIKVLAEHQAGDEDMRRRFEREARAIANLSHPHICHLNDVGRQGDIDFLVMEYLEGETLADRLARAAAAPLPMDDVLRHAIAIADALSEAHRQGIVHRDLKPGNVFLARSGSLSGPSMVKLLDFGLARRHHTPSTGHFASLATMPGEGPPLTQKGTLLGTWQYMAPEQLEGKDADARADIFAFGAVVYEMATGRKAFEGGSHASLIAAILTSDPPPISTLQAMVPQSLDRVVRKCLAKNPDARWQSARDLADELKWIAEERPALPAATFAASAASAPREAGSHDASTAAAAPHSRSTTWRWVAALVGASAAAAAIAWNVPRRDPTVGPIRHFSIEPTAGLNGINFALSPDGGSIVYSSGTPRSTQLYLRPLDQLEARALPDTEGGSSPSFSPDGQSIAFVAGDKIKRVSLASGAPPITLTDLSKAAVLGITWLPDDNIIAARISGGLVRLPGRGGTAVDVTTPDTERREIDHHNPSGLPGGRALLFTVHRGAEAFDVAVQRIDTGERRVLVPDAFDAQYVPTGHLLFARGDSLFAAPFDADRLELTGSPVAVLDNLLVVPGDGLASYQVAGDGSLAYMPTVSRQGRTLVWFDRRGAKEPLPIGPRAFNAPSLSPDGRRIAVQIDEGSRRDIWTYEISTGALARVTFDGASEAPVWTPDGRRLTFSTTRDGRRQIYWQPADGGGQAELLVADEHSVWAGSWSPDLQTMAYTRQPPTDLSDIGLFRLGDRRSAILLGGPALEGWPRISPDGRWLAYASIETRRSEVYVVSLSDPGVKRQISSEGGGRPLWSRDGRELFYRTAGAFAIVPITSLPGGIGTPIRVPITTPMVGGFYQTGYDVSPDGRRLLLLEPAKEESAPGRIHVVLNWVEELKRRVPVK